MRWVGFYVTIIEVGVGEEEMCYSIRILVYSIRSRGRGGEGGVYTVWGYCGRFDGNTHTHR